MLAQRIVARLATTTTISLRQGSQLPRQFIHPSGSQSQAPQPNTWLAKLRLRPDGTPRSKLIAFGFGCLILSNCFTLFEHQTYEKDDPTRKMVTLLRNLIWIQRTNSTYDSVDFRDRTSIITYFKKLCQATSLMSEEGVDLEINNLMARIIYKEMKDGSTRFPGVKALAIMKLTADKIHGAFQELGRDDDHSTAKITKIADVEKTGRFVTNEMYEGLKSLYSLLDLDSDT